MNTFNELQLPTDLEQSLQKMGFQTPTPIQAKAIPVALQRRDLIGCAQTGTGKTAAFCIPIVTRLLKAPNKSALILIPTRELAAQIQEFLVKLTHGIPQIKSTMLIGGMSMQPQVRALGQRPKIIVATPGRLVDHLKRGNLSLSTIEILVLDEADRMLDMGFAPQLNEILRFLPKTRQTLLFSATFPTHIQKLSERFLKDPVRVTVGTVNQAAPKIQQTVIQTTVTQKNDVLMDQLNERKGTVLIFARTQARTDRVAKYLLNSGHQVTRLHGGRTQGQRNSALAGFRDGRFRIMVATDIAARGIDVSHIAHVINYDLPQVPEDFVHRIGRTARAGASGEALSLVTPEDRQQWKEISQLLSSSRTSGDRPVATSHVTGSRPNNGRPAGNLPMVNRPRMKEKGRVPQSRPFAAPRLQN